MAKRKQPENIQNDENLPENTSSPSKRGKGSPASKASPQKASSKKNEKKKKSKKDVEGSLFDIVKKGSAFNPAVASWIKHYQDDKTHAFAELINFLIQSCGWDKVSISTEQLKESDDVDQILERIITADYVKSGEGEYPIVSKKQQYRKFKSNFVDFWNTLITKLPNKILYDNFLIDSLTAWLSAFSLSTARPFRHTTTLAGLEIVSALIVLANRVQNELDNSLVQLRTEKRKSGSSGKLDSLEEKVSKLDQSKEDLQKMMGALFKGIFGHRYRDTVPEIRSACMSSLGSWIMDYRDHFLDDRYLKYLGWCLSDKDPDVRKVVLEALETLYSNQETLSVMQSFTERFVRRMVRMTKDVDASVAAQAIKIITQLASANSLEDSDVNQMYQLITDDNCLIRYEAANFIFQHVFSAKKPKNKRSEKTEISKDQLKLLVDLIVENTLVPDYPNYAVDALWGKVDVLKNWAAMTDILLSDDDSLSDRAQNVLVRLVNVSVKKSLGKNIVPKTKQDPDTKETDKSIKQNQEALTKHFANSLPELLRKFKDDADKVEELVEILQFLSLKLYEEQRQHKALREVLECLQSIFKQHTEGAVLKNTANSLRYLFITEHKYRNDASEVIRQLSSDLVAAVRNNKKSQDLASLAVSLQRLSYLYRAIDIDELLEGVDVFLMVCDLSQIPSCVESVLDILFTHLAWKMAKRPEAKDILDKRNKLFQTLNEFSESDNPEATREKAFLLSTDSLILFSRNLRGTPLHDLAYEAPEDFQSKLQQYFEEQMAVETQFEQVEPQEKSTQTHDASDDEDEDEETEHVKERQPKKNKQQNEVVKEKELETEEKRQLREKQERLVAAIARPVSCKCLLANIVPSILGQFLLHGKQVDDIIKVLLAKLREQDSQNEWKLLFRTLEKVFEAYRHEENSQRQEARFKHFKELCQRLALTYGVNVSEQLRSSIESLLSEGILYAFSGKLDKIKFKFLGDGLSKFVSKLSSDRAEALKTQANQKDQDYELDENNDDDKPYFIFLETLRRVAGGEPAKVNSPKKNKTENKKGSSKVRRNLALELAPSATDKAKGKKRKQTANPEDDTDKATRKSPRKKSNVNYNETRKAQSEAEPESESEQELVRNNKKKK